jgi:membrane protein implicated in regulation of membrane protease activity
MDWFFADFHWWHWLIVGMVLLILEMFSPAAFFMWMGLSAAITGVITLIAPEMSWQIQVTIFSVLSIVIIASAKLWFNKKPIKSDEPLLNERGQELIGHVYAVHQAIVNGEGRIKVGETTWKARGPDAPVGARVRVIGARAAVLEVELAE